MDLPYDSMETARERTERYARERGGVEVGTAERPEVEALMRVRVRLTPGTRLWARMTERALQALCEEGHLEKLTRERYAGVEWLDVRDHPGYQLNSTGLVRNSATGRGLRTREDSRGRELVELSGKAHDTARLTPLRGAAGAYL